MKTESPKRKAQDLISSQLIQLMDGYWREAEEELSEAELEKIQAQVNKISNRFLKLMGFEPKGAA